MGAQPTEAVTAILKVTGDWQKFKGLPGAEGTLEVAAPKPSKTIAFEAAVQAAANEPKTKPKPKLGRRRSTCAVEKAVVEEIVAEEAAAVEAVAEETVVAEETAEAVEAVVAEAVVEEAAAEAVASDEAAVEAIENAAEAAADEAQA